MADNTIDIDPELLSGFIADSLDELDNVTNLFIELENNPGNLDTISGIFRPVHSIKGNSAFFGLMKTKKLAHEMETLLDLARKEKLVPNRAVIDVLLAGVDKLNEILSRTREGQSEIDDQADFDALVERVIAAQNSDEDIEFDTSILFEKLEKLKTECTELEAIHIEELNNIISWISDFVTDSAADECATESNMEVPEQIQKILSIVGPDGTNSVNDQDSVIVMNCLTELKDSTDNPEARDVLELALDEYDTMVNSIGFDPLLGELLLEKCTALSTMDVWNGDTDESAKEKAMPTEIESNETPEPKAKVDTSKDKQAGKSQKTMRVSEDSIDTFLSFVGELIVIGEMYNHLQNEVAESNVVNDNLPVHFKRINEAFNSLSNSLQKSIMDIRKVPVKFLLQKVPKIIRDITTSNGKEIKIELQGENINIDKRLIETLDAPLMHMIRNAADHGIELPDKRKAVGKTAHGTIVVSVTETEDNIVLAITDDGKGLDYDAIKAKAVKLQLIQPDQELTETQVTDLLFASGVSTAKAITDVSGRGVGMDVVKRNIVQANGEIKIHSISGKGSEFSIRLPKAVSTQIIDGYLIKIGKNCYVIPLDKVRDVFRPSSKDIRTVTGKGECVLRHEKLLSIIRLFGISSSRDNDNNDTIMVSLEIDKRLVALQVSDVVGIQRVVLKELDGLELNSEIFTAAAMMGDGTVAMLINVHYLDSLP